MLHIIIEIAPGTHLRVDVGPDPHITGPKKLESTNKSVDPKMLLHLESLNKR